MRGPRPAHPALFISLLWGAVLGCTRENPAFRGPGMAGSEAGALRGASDAADTLAVADAPAPVADAGPPRVPLLHFDFESGADGWKDIRYQFFGVAQTPVTSSSAQAHSGARALAMTLTTTSESVHPTFGFPAGTIQQFLPPGARIEQWVWFPADAPLVGVQGFVYAYRVGLGAWWMGKQTPLHQLVPGAWNRLEHQVPADLDMAAGGVVDFGIEWVGQGPLSGLTVYIDDVSIFPP